MQKSTEHASESVQRYGRIVRKGGEEGAEIVFRDGYLIKSGSFSAKWNPLGAVAFSLRAKVQGAFQRAFRPAVEVAIQHDFAGPAGPDFTISCSTENMNKKTKQVRKKHKRSVERVKAKIRTAIADAKGTKRTRVPKKAAAPVAAAPVGAAPVAAE